MYLYHHCVCVSIAIETCMMTSLGVHFLLKGEFYHLLATCIATLTLARGVYWLL